MKNNLGENSIFWRIKRKMITLALHSKKTTVFVSLLLIAMLILGWSLQQIQAAQSANIVYFAPTNINELEHELTHNDLEKVDREKAAYSAVQQISHFTDWKGIEKLIVNEELDVLIVHHTMNQAVDWEIVKEAFQKRGLVVAGIGIPGNELANSLGAAHLYESKRSLLEEHNFDYFIYSMRVSGNQSEVDQVLNSRLNGTDLTEKVKSPLSFQSATSHGYFSDDKSNVDRFLGLIDGRLTHEMTGE